MISDETETCGADKMSVADFDKFNDRLSKMFQRFCPSCTKVILWQLLTQYYEVFLDDELWSRGEILEDIEDEKEDMVKTLFDKNKKSKPKTRIGG